MKFNIFINIFSVVISITIADIPGLSPKPPTDCSFFECTPSPLVCRKGETPIKSPNECCPKCLTLPLRCKFAKCAIPPKVCPNYGEAPVTPENECCPVCIVSPLRCTILGCMTAPQKSQNRPMVKMQGECCSECTNEDCSKVKCASPTRYCKEGQTPRPRGSCCAKCKLNCTGIRCLRCPFEEIEVFTPNSCCPSCN